LRGLGTSEGTDPVFDSLCVVADYGLRMATFERAHAFAQNCNAIAHFSDWIIAHVHVGALLERIP